MQNKTIGCKQWAIPEGYIPAKSNGPEPAMTSHETICVLNTSNEDANIKVTVFFSDREPTEPFHFIVPARRTKHIRFNDFKDPETLPLDKDFASLIESDIPIIVQHTRLDSRQAENALMTTIAFAGH